MPKLQKDKLGHFLAGVVISMLAGMLINPQVGLLAGMGAGVAKEVIWDGLMGKGTVEVMDAVFTAVGAFAGFVVFSAVVDMVPAIGCYAISAAALICLFFILWERRE